MKKPELYVLILFIIGFLLRIHSLGILDYPGNIKSCDSTQYYLITDFISENGTYTYPKYLTKGVENVLIARPPIFFLINAPLFSLTSFNGWNVQIFTSLFFNSLLILVIYKLTSVVFNSKKTGLLAAALYTLPPNLTVWTWPWYIGLFSQGLGFIFVYFAAYLITSEIRKPNLTRFLLLLLVILGIFLSHFSELALILPFFVYLLIKNFQFYMKNKSIIILFSVLLFIPFILYLPKALTWFGSNTIIFQYQPKLEEDILLFPSIKWLTYPLLACGLVGFFLSRKKSKDFFYFSLYFIILTYVVPHFLYSLYFRRHTEIVPLFLFPFAAFFFKKVLDFLKFRKTYHYLLACIVIILLGLPTYVVIKDNPELEPFSEEKYEIIKYIQQLPKDSKVLFFQELAPQCTYLLTEKDTYFVDQKLLQLMEIEYINNSHLITNLSITCQRYSLIDQHLREQTSFFTFNRSFPISCSQSAFDYDYLYFEMKSVDVYKLNIALINYYNENGFLLDYTKNYSVILKNEAIN